MTEMEFSHVLSRHYSIGTVLERLMSNLWEALDTIQNRLSRPANERP